MKQYLSEQSECHTSYVTKNVIRQYFISLILLLAVTVNAESQYLKRSLSTAPEVKSELSTLTAHYKPLFGAGDDNSGIIRGVSRYGYLVIDSGGKSNQVKYENEEHILFILGGTGILQCGKDKVPVSKNDFMYIPGGMKYGISNPREQPLTLIVMGFKLLPQECVRKTTGLMIANTDVVKFQVLASHGPTAQFELLLGTTESTRDKLAAACKVTSLFIMDFAAGGTNKPHRHNDEEEIYLILRGHGDIVAGEKDGGDELRHPSVEGDVYFYSPKTYIGFYSGNSPEEEHARILAVRFKFPVQNQDTSGKK
jgi:mannose-6-phosphate isomerase-like protein (cupin superfamily)